ncbi:response regulator transcription factor [Pseudomonas sp. R5(2019)]|uniref:response regulator transcription factor n=1 Tax=Pseudomonas sp. R5(2019) TaxID=2697566 RepID=UPI00273FBCA9|nr:response regulator transcription factor [Pseudomonas sp. R5(2019)]NBA97409.1 response regulator [Pseudomonas sp. R5(2019)]
MHKALIVDDHPVIRLAVRMLLENKGYKVVGETGDAAGAIQQARETSPDVVILDIGLPGVDGLEVIDRLKRLDHPPRILVLTAQEPALYSKRCQQAGAAAFVRKGEDLEELLGALRAVMSGYSCFPDLMNSPRTRSRKLHSEEQLFSTLSNREMAVLEQLAKGLSNNAISEVMHLSPKTISTYKTRIMEKLQVNSLVEMVDMAKRLSPI